MRRFTRDGTGEYRINDKVCRWRTYMKACSDRPLPHRLCGNRTGHHSGTGRRQARRQEGLIEELQGIPVQVAGAGGGIQAQGSEGRYRPFVGPLG